MRIAPDEAARLLRATVMLAATSQDPSTQNGALLVDPAGEIVAAGVNGQVVRTRWLPERWEYPAKAAWVEHAERRTIYEAAREGIRTEGLAMVCLWAACPDCARAIVEAGIDLVVTHAGVPCPDRWRSSVAEGLAILTEAGVGVHMVPGPVGGPALRIGGASWWP